MPVHAPLCFHWYKTVLEYSEYSKNHIKIYILI